MSPGHATCTRDDARARQQICRQTGAGKDLVRVEVLVPAQSRQHVLDLASKLRAEVRRPAEWTAPHELLFTEAVSKYRAHPNAGRIGNHRQQASRQRRHGSLGTCNTHSRIDWACDLTISKPRY